MNDNPAPETQPEPQNESADVPQRVECKSTYDPAIRMFIAAVMLIGFGVWCFVEINIIEKYHYVPMSEDINEFSSWALNYFGQFIFPIPGVILAVWAILYLRRRLVADQEGIGYAGKDKVRWDQVTELDATLLKSKGIVVLRYGDGQEMKLDNWKLTNFRELVALVESKVPEEKMRTA